jgi:CRP-like cAMP-binding protein
MSEVAPSAEQLLAKVDLFSGLSHRKLKKVSALARVVDHDAGHTIAAEGLGGLAFHLIVSGKVEVSRADRQVRELGPDEYFGEISMIDGKPRSVTVTTVEPTRTLVIPHLVFEDLVHDEPEFAVGLLKLLCARLREVEAVRTDGPLLESPGSGESPVAPHPSERLRTQ